MSEICSFSYGPLRLETERVIGHIKGSMPGPRVVFIAAIHGNEPSGIVALQEVLARLEGMEISGEILGIVGNMPALASGRRFIDRDLNRLWTEERIGRIKRDELNGEMSWVESGEQVQLLELMAEFMHDKSDTYFIDLHTTSGESIPFMSLSETAENLAFARKFNIPAIVGIEQYIEGPLLNYASSQGHVSIAFEAGQHDSPNAIRNHRCFIKQVIAELGVCDSMEWKPLNDGLDENQFAVVHREVLAPDQQFVMRPGFENFQSIAKGEVLADDKNGPIISAYEGRIFMPLYQKEGTDGFFIIK